MSKIDIPILSHIGKDGISLNYVKGIVDSNQNSEGFRLLMDSEGGDVYEGYAIYNFLKSLNKPIECDVIGICASISTLIALSADKITIGELGRWLVHLPMVDLKMANRIDMEEAKSIVNRIENELVSVYSEKTGKTREYITSLMEKDEFLTSQQAKEIGFVDEIKNKLKAVAYYDKNKSEIKMDKKTTGRIESLLSKLENVISGKKPEVRNVVLTTSGDVSFNIFVDAESEADIVGASAFIIDENGDPTTTPVEDGSYLLEDGRTLIITSGVVESIQEPQNEIDALKEENAALKASLTEKDEELKNQKESFEAKYKEFSSLIDEVKNEISSIKKITNVTKKPAVSTKTKNEESAVFNFNKGITITN